MFLSFLLVSISAFSSNDFLATDCGSRMEARVESAADASTSQWANRGSRNRTAFRISKFYERGCTPLGCGRNDHKYMATATVTYTENGEFHTKKVTCRAFVKRQGGQCSLLRTTCGRG